MFNADYFKSMLSEQMQPGYWGGDGNRKIFAGDKFENKMAREDVARSTLDPDAYMDAYDTLPIRTLFLLFYSVKTKRFLGNATLEATTGKNLGQHIDGWID